MFLALSTAAEFREHLSQFSDFYSNLGKARFSCELGTQLCPEAIVLLLLHELLSFVLKL